VPLAGHAEVLLEVMDVYVVWATAPSEKKNRAQRKADIV
jgi:hypothetical protein